MSFGQDPNRRNMVSVLALSAAILSAPVHAQEVTLRSADGTVDLVGDFIEFTDNNYVIRTGLGDLRISAARVSCQGDACPDFGTAEADITIAGSDTVGLGVMPLLLSGYAGFLGAEATQTATGTNGDFVAELIGDEGFGDPLGSFLVTSSTSADAFASLLDGSSQVGMSARRITPDEARALRDSGAGNMISPAQEHIIAVEGLVIVTHPNNSVDSITMDQLRGIYSGAISNWSEVGGSDAPISLYTREAGSDTREVFEEAVFEGEVPPVPAGAVIVTDNNEMAALVNSDETAIGFTGFAFQRGASAVTLVNDCGISMVPDAFSARTEEYGLQRFLYLYSREDTRDQQTADLIKYVESKGADEVIAKAGFVDLGVDRRAQPLDGDRGRQLLDPTVDAFEGGVMREMMSLMVDYDRLSTTFRFRTGSQSLDPRGQLNLARLADYLETQPEGTQVLFVGFTDDVGAFESNRALSLSRAQQVLSEMQTFVGDRLAGIQFGAAGYGEVAPTACNTTENGRRINRRVEVWIQTSAG